MKRFILGHWNDLFYIRNFFLFGRVVQKAKQKIEDLLHFFAKPLEQWDDIYYVEKYSKFLRNYSEKVLLLPRKHTENHFEWRVLHFPPRRQEKFSAQMLISNSTNERHWGVAREDDFVLFYLPRRGLSICTTQLTNLFRKADICF